MSPSNFLGSFHIVFIDATLYQTKVLPISMFMLSWFLSFFVHDDVQ